MGLESLPVNNTVENESTPLIQTDGTHENENTIQNSATLGENEISNTETNNEVHNSYMSNHIWGLLLAEVSVCCYTCYTLIAKYLLAYRGVPYVQIVFTRSAITWLINLAWIKWYQRHGLNISYFGIPSHRKWLIIRSLTCFATNFLWIWSLLWLTPGDSDTIWQINAFWVLISAHFFLNEKMDIMSCCCICIGIIGVILVAQPTFIFQGYNEYSNELDKWIGIILVLCSTFAYTLHVLIVRGYATDIHWLQFEFVTSTCATWIFIPTVGLCYFLAHYLMLNDAGAAFLTVYNPWIPFTDWIAVISLGVVGCLATATLTRATQLSQARWISLIMYSEIPLAYVGQVIFYHIYGDLLTWIGAAIVLAAVLVPSIREIYLEAMKPKNPVVDDEVEGISFSDDQKTVVINQNMNEERAPLLSTQQNESV